MLKDLMAPDIEELIQSKDYAGLKEGISDWESAEVAELLWNLPEDERPILFRLLHRETASEVFALIPTDDQAALLENMSKAKTSTLLEELAPDDRTELFEELPAEVTQKLMSLLPAEELAVARQLLGYPEESVGRMMTPEYMAVHPEWRVSESLKYIREHGKDAETVNVVYVVDKNGKLIDDLRLRQLILADPRKKISSIMDNYFVALAASDDQEVAVHMFQKYDRIALPVTDSKGVLIGIVTVDDIIDVIQEETTEDFQKMSGVVNMEDPYLHTGFWQLMRKRGGWLSILLIGESFTASAMGFFDSEIQRALVLTLFIPLIISSGGNSGSQAASLIIRAIALGEIRLRDWWRVMLREIASGVVLGAFLGLIAFLRIVLWPNQEILYGEHFMLVGATVACSLVGVVLWGTLSGSMLPFLMQRLGFDPAASSTPLVATLVDVTGLVIYFSLALVILHGTLL